MRGFNIELNQKSYNVRFQTKGRVTYCYFETDLGLGHFKTRTKAICHEGDTFDEYAGAKLAFQRALRKHSIYLQNEWHDLTSELTQMLESDPTLLEVKFEAEKKRQIRKAARIADKKFRDELAKDE